MMGTHRLMPPASALSSGGALGTRMTTQGEEGVVPGNGQDQNSQEE